MCWTLTLPMTEQAYFTSSKARLLSASLMGWCWANVIKLFTAVMEQRALKNVNNHLNINIYSYLETYGGQSSNIY
jgi:hypothetical protein